MNETDFDRLTRRCATRLSRRGVLRFAIGGALAALPLRRGTPTTFAQSQSATGPSEASELVLQFYENVDAYRYADAYALLGAKWRGQQSVQRFTDGYHNTAFVQCRTTGEVANGDQRVVQVELISWHNDGKIVAYQGQYTVGQEDGAGRISVGNNTPTSVPRETPPLCTTADLSFALGPWDAGAGNRTGSIVATNTGDATCALGGSPAVRLTDSAGRSLDSTSQPGSAPEAIVLAPNDTAQAPLRFANWCGETGAPDSITVQVPGDTTGTGEVDRAENGIAYPPCNGASEDALLEIKGWTMVES